MELSIANFSGAKPGAMLSPQGGWDGYRATGAAWGSRGAAGPATALARAARQAVGASGQVAG